MSGDKQYRDESWLREKYDEGLTQEEIADICDVSQNTISTWTNKFQIETRVSSRGETVECETCGTEMDVPQWRVERSSNNFCSHKCADTWKESAYLGNGNHNFDEDSTWREGFTSAERKKILERDDYTCQDCGGRPETLYAHHIIPVYEDVEKAHDIENGVALCAACHADRHEELGDKAIAELIRSQI